MHLKIHVSIEHLSSVEGIWCREKKAIVLSSLRPAGRRAFTCAHELGHWHFDHGTRADELVSTRTPDRNQPEENAANQFAGHLLMPPCGVASTLETRKWSPSKLTAVQAYALASYFGVSYAGFLGHMCYALRSLEQSAFEKLSEVEPKDLRKHLCPELSAPNLIVVDEHWLSRPIDLEVGDALMFPSGAIDSAGLIECRSRNSGVASAAGVSQLTNLSSGRTPLIRVAESGFRGYAQFRYPTHNNVYSDS